MGRRFSLTQGSEKVFLERTDFAKRFGMVERQQVFGEFVMVGQIDFAEARFDLREGRRVETGLREGEAERVDVVTERNAAQQRGLNRCGAAAHEGIVNYVARLRQAFDEKARELRFEAGAIGNFVERTGLALARGPELIDERGDRPTLAGGVVGGLELSRGRAELAKLPEFGRERPGIRTQPGRIFCGRERFQVQGGLRGGAGHLHVSNHSKAARSVPGKSREAERESFRG